MLRCRSSTPVNQVPWARLKKLQTYSQKYNVMFFVDDEIVIYRPFNFVEAYSWADKYANQRSWVQIPYRPEFFSDLIFTTA